MFENSYIYLFFFFIKSYYKNSSTIKIYFKEILHKISFTIIIAMINILFIYTFFEELLFLVIAKYKASLKLHQYEFLKEPLFEKLSENSLDFLIKKFNNYPNKIKLYEKLLFSYNENNENIDYNSFFIAGELTETFYVFFKLGIFVLFYTTYPLIIIKTILWFLPTGTKIKKFYFSQILIIYLILFISVIWIVHSINLPILWRFFSYQGLGTNIIETEIGLNHIVMFTIKNYIIFIFFLHQTMIQFLRNPLKINFNLFRLKFKLSKFFILKLIHSLKFKLNTKFNHVYLKTITQFKILKNLHMIFFRNFIAKILLKNHIKIVLIFYIVIKLEEQYKPKFYIIFILYYLMMLLLLLLQITRYIKTKYKANNGI